jgi:ribosomal protein S18 acetylase RimI-like enzyme
MVNEQVSLRPAVLNDQARIANLIYFEAHVHRHLDWRSPLDWLGAPEYWVIEQGGSLLGVLACPSDLPGVAWIRLFAHSRSIPMREAWNALWYYAREQIVQVNHQMVAAITLQPWFADLLKESSFSLAQQIVVLEHQWAGGTRLPSAPRLPVRAMTADDVPAVAALDAAAFKPIWQNSLVSIQMAFAQAGLATVIEENGRLLGYQISTANPFGMHLARLAVAPEAQGRGLGTALVEDLLHYAGLRGMNRITVNTQADNQPSLALYQKLGFRLTGEQYPVYAFQGRLE